MSTTDAIIKLGSYLAAATKDAQIVLMDLAKAFGKVNRARLWTTLYKNGLPMEMIQRVRRGHQGTTILPKTKGKYGIGSPNNIGVFQGSAISALLFVIYKDDMMGDYDALSREKHRLLKHTHK